jgi:glucosamine-phosphate N-acetyltransferase
MCYTDLNLPNAERREIMPDTKRNICTAQMTDLAGIVWLLLQLSPSKTGEDMDSGTGREILKSIMENPDYCLCVAKIGSRIVGTATLLIQLNLSHGGKPYAHLENVVTDIAFRRKGIGREMVSYLTEKARGRGCYKVILNCESKNIPFYKCCGFRETGEVEMRL